MNESKVIELLKGGRQEKAFKQLYRFYPKMEKHICINSGSKAEALDIFQEALIILYRKVSTGISDNQFSCEGYLITTCKLLWSNELRKKKIRTGGESGLENLVHDEEIQASIEKENQFKIVENVLLKLGSKCKSILEQFYFRSLSMESIAKKFGFKTVDAAKVQKYRCLETARKMALESLILNKSSYDESSEDHKTENL